MMFTSHSCVKMYSCDVKVLMKVNLLGYTYKIYNSGYNTEMINKQCNAGDPLEAMRGLYRGPPSIDVN